MMYKVYALGSEAGTYKTREEAVEACERFASIGIKAYYIGVDEDE